MISSASWAKMFNETFYGNHQPLVIPEFWHGDDWQKFAFAAHPSTVPLFHSYDARSTRRWSTYRSRMQPMKLVVLTARCLPAKRCPGDSPPSWNGPVRSRKRWQVSVTSRHLGSIQKPSSADKNCMVQLPYFTQYQSICGPNLEYIYSKRHTLRAGFMTVS